MELVTGRCDICNEEIVPGKSQAQFNRNLGVHKRKRHGILGSRPYKPKPKPVFNFRAQQLASLEKARKARWANRPTPDESARLARNKIAREKYRAKKAGLRAQRQPRATVERQTILPEGSTPANPCTLPACPACGAKFYFVPGKQQ